MWTQVLANGGAECRGVNAEFVCCVERRLHLQTAVRVQRRFDAAWAHTQDTSEHRRRRVVPRGWIRLLRGIRMSGRGDRAGVDEGVGPGQG